MMIFILITLAISLIGSVIRLGKHIHGLSEPATILGSFLRLGSDAVSLSFVIALL